MVPRMRTVAHKINVKDLAQDSTEEYTLFTQDMNNQNVNAIILMTNAKIKETQSLVDIFPKQSG